MAPVSASSVSLRCAAEIFHDALRALACAFCAALRGARDIKTGQSRFLAAHDELFVSAGTSDVPVST